MLTCMWAKCKQFIVHIHVCLGVLLSDSRQTLFTVCIHVHVHVHVHVHGCVGRVGMPQKIFNPPSQFSRLGIQCPALVCLC